MQTDNIPNLPKDSKWLNASPAGMSAGPSNYSVDMGAETVANYAADFGADFAADFGANFEANFGDKVGKGKSGKTE